MVALGNVAGLPIADPPTQYSAEHYSPSLQLMARELTDSAGKGKGSAEIIVASCVELLQEPDPQIAIRKFDHVQLFADFSTAGCATKLTEQFLASFAEILFRRVSEFPGISHVLRKHHLPYAIEGAPVSVQLEKAITHHCWAMLVRTLDEDGLLTALEDTKMKSRDGKYRIYVPEGDTKAVTYFREVVERVSRRTDREVVVVPIKKNLTPSEIRALDDFPGVLSLRVNFDIDDKPLPSPYLVPGDRFNDLYYWDSKFAIDGLCCSEEWADLARNTFENCLYAIEHYGFVPNGNRSYYLSRSQPPFLTSMAISVAQTMKAESEERRDLLRRSILAAVSEYEHVWTAPDHLDPKSGLSRYFDRGDGLPKEVEPGHYRDVLKEVAAARNFSVEEYLIQYRNGTLRDPVVDKIADHDRAMRESGRDTSLRFMFSCSDLCTVDLNCLLFKYETDIADILDREFGGQLEGPDGVLIEASTWRGRAAERRERMVRHMWDDELGVFVDYNLAEGRKQPYTNPAMMWPLWCKMATTVEAERIIAYTIPRLMERGGIAASDKASRDRVAAGRPFMTQWDNPVGWAPDQMMIYEALANYEGHSELQEELAYRWLYLVMTEGLRHGGIIVEKYDVRSGSQEVHAEYGQQGYRMFHHGGAGFAWTNASVIKALEVLQKGPRGLRASLDRMFHPFNLFRVSSERILENVSAA